MGNFNKLSNAFKDEPSIQESNSVANSTASLQTFVLDPPMEYEEIIQKLEADIRKHIRIQNQLKLHIENIQAKSDENEKLVTLKEKENEQLTQDVKKLKQSLVELDRKKEMEIKRLKEDNDIEVK